MASIIPIIQSIITVGGVLMGAWLGSRLMRGKEERQWRRDRCLEIYTDFILACEIVANQADQVVVQRKHETNQDTSDIELLYEKIKDMSRAADKALLLIPREMMDSIQELVTHCSNLSHAATRSPNADEWKKVRITEHTPLTSNFMYNARNDLGIHPQRQMMSGWRKIFRKPK
jgi:hypothetical protein